MLPINFFFFDEGRNGYVGECPIEFGYYTLKLSVQILDRKLHNLSGTVTMPFKNTVIKCSSPALRYQNVHYTIYMN